MSLALDKKDEPLEVALSELGKLQPNRKLNKTAMLRLIAWAAIDKCKQNKNPLAWKGQ